MISERVTDLQRIETVLEFLTVERWTIRNSDKPNAERIKYLDEMIADREKHVAILTSTATK